MHGSARVCVHVCDLIAMQDRPIGDEYAQAAAVMSVQCTHTHIHACTPLRRANAYVQWAHL